MKVRSDKNRGSRIVTGSIWCAPAQKNSKLLFFHGLHQSVHLRSQKHEKELCTPLCETTIDGTKEPLVIVNSAVWLIPITKNIHSQLLFNCELPETIGTYQDIVIVS